MASNRGAPKGGDETPAKGLLVDSATVGAANAVGAAVMAAGMKMTAASLRSGRGRDA